MEFGRNIEWILRAAKIVWKNKGRKIMTDPLHTYRIGFYVVVEGWAGLKVRWDGHDGVYVEMTKKYKDITCGLCGNFNGNKDDDMMTPQVSSNYRFSKFFEKSQKPQRKNSDSKLFLKSLYVVEQFACATHRLHGYRSPYEQRLKFLLSLSWYLFAICDFYLRNFHSCTPKAKFSIAT